ncbi:MAG: hypothetical protein A3H97_13375 [Acidobacteria bacterium RIFCSPLOWO2_02_FULL_65_29]|nr:MAG: hypothetical protein A3H97_13375 [Acidobacteria bacterium RIFCSPLOWO2_02_FULL_65_29]
MKRAVAVVAGIVVGIAFAGPVVSFVPWLPAPLRNVYVVWGVAALVVAVSARAAWTMSRPRRE